MALGRTPRELLASVTSAEITEAMAWERIEPFGALHSEYLMGTLAALIANIHRKEGVDPFTAVDFAPALRRATENEASRRQDEGLRVASDDEQARLLARTVFGGDIPPPFQPPPGGLAALDAAESE